MYFLCLDHFNPLLHNIRFLYIRLGELNASNNMCCFALGIGRIVYNCKSLYAHQINDVKEEDVKNLKKSKKLRKITRKNERAKNHVVVQYTFPVHLTMLILYFI